MNNVTLIGNVGKDAETKGAICVFTVATSDGYGENKKTNWHNIKCFGKQAETAAKYIKTGMKLAVTGSIDYSEKDGKYYTNINCNSFEFLDSKQTQPAATDNGANDYSDDLPY